MLLLPSTSNGWRLILNSSKHGPRHLAVVGHPIAHSQSPALHRAAFTTLNLAWTYDAIDLAPGGLAEFVQGLDDSWIGLSVTMPHKAQALKIADSVDLIGRATGSVNTLVFSFDAAGKRHISGYNTDVSGMVLALAAEGLTSARHVAIIGGGATAASAVVAAAQLGAESVTVLVRNVTSAQSLLDVGETVGTVVAIHNVNDMENVPCVDLVISTLPGTAETSLDSLTRTPMAPLLDVAYSPWPSLRGAQWASQPERRGAVVSGLSMLAHQALIQVRLFHSGDAAVELPSETLVRSAMFAAVGLP
ncbi:shikimate dehydrogenase [Alpinimonas psychrophila]